MIRNYIKIAWRNLTRNKVSSMINISGLAIGLASVILIGLYIKDEFSYDRFFKDTDRIYRVNLDVKVGNDQAVAGHTPPPAGAALTKTFPEIESYTRIFRPGDEVIHFTIKGQKNSLTEKKLLSVDSNFLQFFDYKLLAGNAATCLQDPNALVLTQKAAKKYFGDADPMGKTLVFDEYKQPFKITGVLQDIPTQSSLQFDVLQSNVGMPPIKRFSWSWVWLQMGTYVKLKAGVPHEIADIKRLEAKFPAMMQEQAASAFIRVGQPLDEMKKKGNHWDLHLQPLKDVHLYSGNIFTRYFEQGDIKNVYIFSAVAVFIMLLACVNFMNLSTAQSGKRGKEVGIRKVLGSPRGQLISQFFAEALVYTAFAAVLALGIVIMALPAFNQLSGKALDLSVFYNLSTWASLLLVIAITGLLAGSYPAFFLTSFNPVQVLKGSGLFKTTGGNFLARNSLVVFQFMVSTFLIICTIVVYKQLMYSHTLDIGLDRQNVVIINNADRLGQSEESMRQEILKMPGIVNATITTGIPSGGSFGDFYTPEIDPGNIKRSENTLPLSSYLVDESFMPTLGMRIVDGRAFSKNYADSASVVLNEAAVKQTGWKNAIGKTLVYPGNANQKFTVVGVVKDFNTESLHAEVTPFALFYTTSKTYRIRSSYILIKVKPDNYSATLNQLQSKWKSFLPDTPFEYSFLDAEFDALYRADQTMGKVFSVFTFLSLTVACLGLLGLAIYTAERRTKEIGIRKVLGASVQNVVQMLSKDFLKLVIIASVIAFPLAWYAMNMWLQDFAYRTAISWWVFALAGGLTVVIALLTVSFQSVKAAVANPVKSLRSE
ncbi:ABC transporter permease [Mucilaginibacter mali]|uniref:ABC transporter permease n=1 Tax=Mucilaginibacter mali TaxID=2740462 RepID=A0A7D4QK11_9SPHI|nr:ABC transporter permease [Mucilaginibacter mali]QKJ30090.1 ABC transporter permease [Mucilaginibacter mali]